MEEVFTADALRFVSKGFLEVFVTTCLFVFPGQNLQAQQPHGKAETQYSIERIEIVGNRRVETAKLLNCIISRVGDAYNEDVVRRDVQAIRDTGFFEDVRIEVDDSPHKPNGKIVAFDVKERPVIRRIEYRGIRSISEADIENAYKKNKITLSVESWFDPEKMTRAATAIKELLAAHGYPCAVVKPTYERTASSTIVAILFTIDERPKVPPSPNSH